MAAFDRPTEATYAINESITVDTTDREDHTFCGIMFPIRCKKVLPVDHIVIRSISVRGALGPLTVWVSKGATYFARNSPGDSNNDRNLSAGIVEMKKMYWNKIYERDHKPSFTQYCELKLQSPIVLKPGQVKAIYVHSTRDGDQAIVYDNKQKDLTYDDEFISMYAGRSHVSDRPFGTIPIWGWGNAWRDNREFVGKVNYGVVYRLWNPNLHFHFGSKFQTVVTTLLACQRRDESPFSRLPDDCIFYILNMCRWDWVKDQPKAIHQEQRQAFLQKKGPYQITNNNEQGMAFSEQDGQKKPSPQDNTPNKPSSNHSESVKTLSDDDDDDDDSNYEEESSDEEDDDGYEDHRAGSTFHFTYRDDFVESDDDEGMISAQEYGYTRNLNRFLRVRLMRALLSPNDNDGSDDHVNDRTQSTTTTTL